VQHAHRRNGIVSEAAQACIAWGFEHFLIDRIVAFARAGNSASLAVMAGLNMRFKGYTERYYGERLVQFTIERPGS
jgi:RimJ/RimL family protein N-acetyltransferase